MTPKEKADELIDKMYYIGRYDDKEDYNPAMAWERAKQCALIAVEEIIAAIPTQPSVNETERIDAIMYWIAVKQEIEKL
jgi:hypothetical protein